jgi:purine-binding chemotaxis protein CheW
MEKQLVIFKLAEAYFGVDIATVEAIVKMQAITQIPHTPSYVEGITNLRGAVLPVIDLEKRFGLESQGKTRETRIVVVAMDSLKVGMIVDAVSEVLTIEDTVIEPIPPMATTVDTEFITGVAKIDSRLVILLDLARVLTEEEKHTSLAMA